MGIYSVSTDTQRGGKAAVTNNMSPVGPRAKFRLGPEIGTEVDADRLLGRRPRGLHSL